MISFILTFSLLYFTSQSKVGQTISTSPYYRELYNRLKEKAPFKVYSPEETPFRDYTEEDLKKGLMHIKFNKLSDSELKQKVSQTKNKVYTHPVSYSFYEEYPNCTLFMKDQAHCGSCWAHSIATSLGYRFCQKSKTNVEFATQEIVSCIMGANGCNGGWPNVGFDYIEKNGISLESCFPYTSYNGLTISCSKKCTSDGSEPIKYYATAAKEKLYGAEEWREELYTNGPMAVCFEVFEDFYFYEDGVYIHTEGKSKGLHAVSLVGYGVEDGVEYFLLQNSWGTDSGVGRDGMIKMGIDQCDLLNYGADYGYPITE